MYKKTIGIIAVGLLMGMFLTVSIMQSSCCARNKTHKKTKIDDYTIIDFPTPNIESGTNLVQGVVLHHTATLNVERALGALCNPERGISCHAVIDRDGTRYILASPDKITHHAGYSMLLGKSSCNKFTIGIEFQGNTCVQPLTEAQINSAINYLLPILKKYKIPISNIVTHQQVRDNWLKKHPDRKDVPTKVDITPTEYNRFIKALKARYPLT